MITTNTYLHFNGNCEEAFKFYAETFGGKILMTMKGKDAPSSAECSPEFGNKILHTRMTIGSAVLMGSDCPPGFYDAPKGLSVNIGVDSPTEADRIYAELAKGGIEKMPIAETFWAERFGMCIDRFGTPWMVNCEKKQ
jgi:PhnB protein